MIICCIRSLWYLLDYITSKLMTGHRIPRWHSGKESSYQCWEPKRREFDSWVGKILQSRKMATGSLILAWKVILAWKIPWKRVLEGYSPWGHTESDTNKQLSTQYTQWLDINFFLKCLWAFVNRFHEYLEGHFKHFCNLKFCLYFT